MHPDLEAFLDEALPVAAMAELEERLRSDAALRRQLAEVCARRDAGVHSLAAIWRRHRITCPTREQLGSYLLGVLEPAHSAFLKIHLDQTGCRACQANLADLQPTLPGGGLLDDVLHPKPAFQRLQLMREKFKQYQKK